MKSIIVTIQENRYSFSPLITISEFFNVDVDILFLKDISQNLDDSQYLENIKQQILKSRLKVDNEELNIFFFSIHGWFRRFFLSTVYILKKYFPDSLFIAGGPDVVGAPDLYFKYFDILSIQEGELFLIDLFELLQIIEKRMIDDLIISDIAFSYSQFSRINFKTINSPDKFFSEKQTKNLYVIPASLLRSKKFLIDYYIKNSEELSLTKSLLEIINCKINQIDDYKDIFKFFPLFPIRNNFYHPLEIVRGCPQACKYCQVGYFFGKIPRCKDLDILKIFIFYQLKNNKKHIRFISPNLALYFEKSSISEKIDQWIQLIEDVQAYSYRFQIKPEIYLGSFPSELSLSYLNSEFLDFIAKYSASKILTIGVQTVSKELQNFIGRYDPLGILDEAIDFSVKKSLIPIIDIIFGLPYETDSHRDITLSFLEKKLNDNVTANIHYFLPIAGTPFEDFEPSPIGKNDLKRILNLQAKGFARGNFLKQMSDYRTRLKIPDNL